MTGGPPDDVPEEVYLPEPDDEGPSGPSGPTPRPGRSAAYWLKAAFLVVALLLIAVEVVLIVRSSRSSLSDRSEGSAGGSARRSAEAEPLTPPDRLPDQGSYVASEVRPDGTIAVTQWFRSETPVRRLVVAAPDTPEPAEARGGVIVAGDGEVLVADLAVGPERQSLDLGRSAKVLRLTYRLHGVVDRSTPVAGQALAQAVALDVDYDAEEGPTRVFVTGGQILDLGCADRDADVSLRLPCGAPDGPGWMVTLPEADRDDRVSAQLDLG